MKYPIIFKAQIEELGLNKIYNLVEKNHQSGGVVSPNDVSDDINTIQDDKIDPLYDESEFSELNSV